jgi:hypothetical protein
MLLCDPPMLKKNNANQYIIVGHSFKHDIALFNVTLVYSLPIKRAIFQQQCMQSIFSSKTGNHFAAF